VEKVKIFDISIFMGIFVSDLHRSSVLRSLDSKWCSWAETWRNAVPALFPRRSSFSSNYDGI